MRRTAEDAERTRVALLVAALFAFEEKAWRGATLDHVAERAGVTRGALHHHFRSKEALLDEALGWGWGRYGARLFGPDDEARSDAPLDELVTGYLSLLRDEPLFRALAVTTVLVAPQALDDVSAKNAALDAWGERITALVPTGAADSAGVSPESVTRLTLTLLQGLTVTAVTRPHDLPRPDELGAALSALDRCRQR